jgi:hypothetical protein
MNTTDVAFNVTRPLTVTTCSLAASPRRRTILSRIGALLFAAADDEAGWRGWEIHERNLGLGRRYRDPRFSQRDTWTDPAESRPATPDTATGGE